MKVAAGKYLGADVVSPFACRSDPFQDVDNMYEGLPNTWIKDVVVGEGGATLWLETASKQVIKREISNLEYVIGRRGSLDYLDEGLRVELLGDACEGGAPISGDSLRAKVDKSVEVAERVYAVGSLAGDSLIRFAYGGCVLAARGIIAV